MRPTMRMIVSWTGVQSVLGVQRVARQQAGVDVGAPRAEPARRGPRGRLASQENSRALTPCGDDRNRKKNRGRPRKV